MIFISNSKDPSSSSSNIVPIIYDEIFAILKYYIIKKKSYISKFIYIYLIYININNINHYQFLFNIII